MLEYLKETNAARILEQATAEVFKEGKAVTYDFKEDRDDPTAVGTSEMADAIIAKVKKLK
jgi:isocitrate dehydrogenase (NADP) (EC 1.1.1.42)